MGAVRIALANLPIAATRDESVSLAEGAIEEAAQKRAHILCFPECYVPGYRTSSRTIDPPDDAFLQQAWSRIAAVAGRSNSHEGWRYPETVRWAVRHGAQVVFHPHFQEPEPGGYRPTAFGDPANTFHEKAALCRAAENTCFVATVNGGPGNAGTTQDASERTLAGVGEKNRMVDCTPILFSEGQNH